MSLRKIYRAAIAPLAAGAITTAAVAQENAPPEASTWEVSGFARVLTETGDLANNLGYADLVVNGKKGPWTISVAPDLVDKDPETIGGKIDPRLAFATIAYKTGDCEVKAGQLQPFTDRISGAEFDSGMMGAYLSDAFTVQGGIVGGRIGCTQDITDSSNVTWHAMGGSKIPGFSEFGNPSGPGFKSAIWGMGADYKTELDSGVQIETGYNYRHFGEGPNGDSEKTHYGYAHIKKQVDDVTLQLVGEVAHGITQNRTEGYKTDNTQYVVMGQAIGPLANDFGWRAAGGIANDNPAVEAFVTYKPGDWAVQLGGATVFDGGDPEFIGNMVLKRNF